MISFFTYPLLCKRHPRSPALENKSMGGALFVVIMLLIFGGIVFATGAIFVGVMNNNIKKVREMNEKKKDS